MNFGTPGGSGGSLSYVWDRARVNGCISWRQCEPGARGHHKSQLLKRAKEEPPGGWCHIDTCGLLSSCAVVCGTRRQASDNTLPPR